MMSEACHINYACDTLHSYFNESQKIEIHLLPFVFYIVFVHYLWNFDLRLIEPLIFFETHYWRFHQTYVFENNWLLEVYRVNKLKESHGC